MEIYNTKGRPIKPVLSATIFLFITMVTLTITGFVLIKSAVAGGQIYMYEAAINNGCTTYTHRDVGDKNVILRLDDIQGHAWQDTQITMLDDVMKDDIPMSLGVIPKGLRGDKRIYYFLKRNRCKFEIAQHGWDHGGQYDEESPEFVDLSKEDAYKRIMRGKKVLEKLVEGSITTFIPPNNAYSKGTAEALDIAGFTVLSAAKDSEYGYTVSTFDGSLKELTPISDVLDACEKSWVDGKTCIIMLHPQDYMTDNKLDRAKYENYFLPLLQGLSSLDADFITFEDLAAAQSS